MAVSSPPLLSRPGRGHTSLPWPDPAGQAVHHAARLLRTGLVLLAIFLVPALFPGVATATDTVIRLLQETSDAGFQQRSLVHGQARFRIRAKALQAMARQQAKQILLPVMGKATLFKLVRQKRNRNRTITWTGRTGDGSTTLLTLGKDHFFARVVQGGRVTVFRPRGRDMISEVLDPAMAIALEDDMAFPAASEPSVTATDTGATDLQPRDAAPANSDRLIDVMVLYTPGMAAAYPGDTVLTRIQYLVDLGNQAFLNSAIHARFRLVHAEEKNYADSGSMDAALTALTAGDGVFNDVDDLRNLYGADQVTLLRRYVDEGCGLAWIMQSSDPDHAFAVVHDGRNGNGFYCDDLTYIHEIGHNLGCAHDRAHAGGGGMYAYSYGYQFQADGSWYRTIMSYDCQDGCAQISYFSNPAVLYNNVATGVTAGLPDAADNGDTINRTSYLVQDYRQAADPDLVTNQTALEVPGPATEVGSPAYTDPALYIENHGIGYLQIGQVGRTIPPPFFIDTDSCSNQEIAPSWLNPSAPEHCIIRLRFEPASPGVYSAQLEIPSNDPDTPLLTLAVTGTAQSTPPWITAAPTSLQFGSVNSGVLEVLLANRGGQVLEIGSIGRSGPDSAPFAVLADGCSGQVLAMDQSCSVRVSFTPTDSARYRDSLLVPNNDPRHAVLRVPLTGGVFPWNLFLPAMLR